MAVLEAPPATSQEPQLALNVTAEYVGTGLPSTSDVVALLAVITRALDIACVRSAQRAIPGSVFAQTFALTERAGAPLLVAGGHRGIASYRLDGRPMPPSVLAGKGAGWVSSLLVVDDIEPPILVTGGYGRIRSWSLDAEPGGLMISGAHVGWVTSLRLYGETPDQLLLSSGADGAIRSWQLDGQEGPVSLPNAHLGGVRALVTFSDASKRPVMVSGGADGRLLFAAGDRLEYVRAHRGAVAALAVFRSGDDTLVISGGDDGRVIIYSADGEQFGDVTPLVGLPVTSLAVTPDGNLLLVGYQDGSVRVAALGGGHSSLERALEQRAARRGPVTGLHAAIVDEHLLLVSDSLEGPLRVWRESPPSAREMLADVPQTPIWDAFASVAAQETLVSFLSLRSPLQFLLQMPPEVYGAGGLGLVVYWIKRLFGYDLELRSYRQLRQNELLEAQIRGRELQEQLAASGEDPLKSLEATVEDWRVVDAAIIDAEEQISH